MPLECHVIDEGANAQRLFVPFNLGIGMADAGVCLPANFPVFPQGFGGQQNRIDDLDVTGAPADIGRRALTTSSRLGLGLLSSSILARETMPGVQ